MAFPIGTVVPRGLLIALAIVVGAATASSQEGSMSSDDLEARLGAVKDRGTLAITTIGRRSGKPHTVPIWFVAEGTTLYLGTLNAKRDWVRNLAKNPEVGLDIGGLSLRGRATTVTDAALEHHIHDLLAGKYWMAWIGSWFGKGPERAFRVDGITAAAS